MKKLLLTAMLGFCLPVYAADEAKMIEGTYSCKATELNEQAKIPGTMVLTKTDKTFSVKSSFTDNTSYVGTGIYNPKTRNFSFIFTDEKSRAEKGIVVGELKGSNFTSTWTYLDKTSTGNWNCNKQSA